MNGRVPIVIRYMHSAAIAGECFLAFTNASYTNYGQYIADSLEKPSYLRRAARGLEAPDPTRASNLVEVPRYNRCGPEKQAEVLA